MKEQFMKALRIVYNYNNFSLKNCSKKYDSFSVDHKNIQLTRELFKVKCDISNGIMCGIYVDSI